MALILGLLLGPVLVAANDQQESSWTAEKLDQLKGGEKIHALIEAVVERQRALVGLRSEFTQVKEGELFLEPVTSVGDFCFLAPDRVRWDYLRPEGMVVVFADDTMTTFQPGQSRAEKIKVSKRQRRFVRVLAGTQPLDELTSNFAVALADPGGSKPYRLTLTPTHSYLKKKLKSVILEVDRKLLLPVVVEYHEIDGDSTRYEFRNMQLNPSLKDSLFTLELGADVAIETIDVSGAAGN